MSRIVDIEDILLKYSNNNPVADITKIIQELEHLPEYKKCKECQFYRPHQKPVEDFDGQCLARHCETDEEEFCSYNLNDRGLNNGKTNRKIKHIYKSNT